MKCPHCKHDIYPQTSHYALNADNIGTWQLIQHKCPGCDKFSFILFLEKPKTHPTVPSEKKHYLVWPKGIARDPVPVEVPSNLAEDYTEACLVLVDSPKASAALSRRYLQHLIENYAKIKKPNLEQEITDFILTLPSFIGEQVDAIRKIGNFAAHPIKSTNSGEVTDVEPHEAEWNLEVLEMLFDQVFVKPAISAKKKAAINVKLKEAGKPEMK